MEVLVRVWRRFSSSLRYRYRYKISGNFVIHKAPNGTFVYIDNKEYKSTFSLTTYSQGEGGGGYLGLIFVGYVQLVSQSPYPIIVYSVANYRPHISHF